MMSRTQISLDPALLSTAKRKAAELGISLGEYIRRLLRTDLETGAGRQDFSPLFGIGRSGGSDIAAHKDEYIAEAITKLHPRR
jgi:hypothetical protein